MPTTESFRFQYSTVEGIAGLGDRVTIRAVTEPPDFIGTHFDLVDNFDDAEDGLTVAGSSVQVEDFINPHVFRGFTAAGDPIFTVAPAFLGDTPPDELTIFSNTPNLVGATLDTVAGGIYYYCFAEATRIATPTGECPVENLGAGDSILCADGRETPVKWVGRQTIMTAFGGAGGRARLVRIAAGALGPGLPHSDLTVTADHGMVIDGTVVDARAMVNGSTITWVPRAELPDVVTVYHVETEAHDVILANGAPTETFIDYTGRRAFDNHAEYVALYGAERILPEMRLPRITSARHLPGALRRKLGLVRDDADRLTG